MLQYITLIFKSQNLYLHKNPATVYSKRIFHILHFYRQILPILYSAFKIFSLLTRVITEDIFFLEYLTFKKKMGLLYFLYKQKSLRAKLRYLARKRNHCPHWREKPGDEGPDVSPPSHTSLVPIGPKSRTTQAVWSPRQQDHSKHAGGVKLSLKPA